MESGLRQEARRCSDHLSAGGDEFDAAHPRATGRCAACARIAYDGDQLCRVCRGQLAYVDSMRVLGRPHAETPSSRALHRWMRRQERRARLRFCRDWLLGVLLAWALGYIVFQFACMFWVWMKSSL
jgi:hypothetical protein